MARPRNSTTSPRARERRTNVSDRLSPVTENYLLSLYKMWEGSETPTLTQLAEALRQLPPTEGLGTSVPSVAGMLRRMQEQSLVDVGSDKRIRLTQRGVSEGENIAQRHRLAEWMVVSLLEMELHEAHVEAHQLEHGMSETLVTRLKDRLGNPTHSPFGWPIPGSGAAASTSGAVTLDSAAAGAPYVVDRVPEENADLLRFLAGARLVPYHRVTLLEAMPYLGVMQVETEVDRVSIGYDVARQIVVRPHEPEP
ncbi:MAG: metal-dependent transcriptional regulator [Chloroflexota bacterium]|nr:metal-dependent transcriptional regulator [Chloroflexota bacterium]MDE2959804.1 metal-dependent transcriptional regulator [Chloroflexota bacterium]